jgi:hypothetical protein
VSRPTDEDAAYLEEYLAKKQKKGKHEEEVPIEEKSQLHIKDEKVRGLVDIIQRNPRSRIYCAFFHPRSG